MKISAIAQDETPSDSVRFYSRIQYFSEERKLTRVLYKLIFKPVHTDECRRPQNDIDKQNFAPFEGKVIRTIDIKTMDPFGYITGDTSALPENFFENAGNHLHISTFPLTIKNRLIIKKYDTFDSLRVRESMRLLRGQSYIREVFLFPMFVPGTDSVDLFIKAYDVWSFVAIGTITKSGFRINIKDKNFLGLGHQFQNDYSLNHSNGDFSNSTDYLFSNILNTYITTTFHYDTDQEKNYNGSCNFDRPFYSVFTKWAGGAYLQQHLSRSIFFNEDSLQYVQNTRFLTQDYWIGKSWQIFRGKTENERITNFIISARMFNTHFYESLPEESDTNHLFSNTSFYLSSIGFLKRKYQQDNYIFKFGFTEDVPVGRAFSIIGGRQVRDNDNKWYIGAKTFWGNYYPLGYFSSNLEYGTFISSLNAKESCLSGGVMYFSRILQIGNWKMRQFIKPHFTIGINRLKTDHLNLNNEWGIRGFNGTGISGTQKLILAVQTQFYSPWNIIGFRLGPYFVCSFGMLGNESSGFKRSPLYSQFGFGMLIKNDFLVMNSFEISVAYFPYIPGIGDNIFKPNPFRTTDFGFWDSAVGKPTTVSYR